MSVVLPGDLVNTDDVAVGKKRPLIGPGLVQMDSDTVCSCKAGLIKRKPNMVWVDSRQKRYVAMKGDSVIGIVTARQADSFRVDIGTSDPASLSYLSFEGATKKNRPDVKVGDVIFGKLLVANKNMDPELVCIDSFGKANGMGAMKDGGTLVHLNLHWTRRLLSPECSLLKLIGDQLPYETAMGLNGRIWIKGRSPVETLAISRLLQNGEGVAPSAMNNYVTKTINKVVGVK
ncbi:exosome complex component RRP40-like isoform X2 [Watersipora subatra]